MTKFLYNHILPKLFTIQHKCSWVPIIGGLIRAKKRAIEYLHLRQGDTVLVASIGDGFELDFIMPKIGKTGHVIGIDFSASMLQQAQDKINRKQWKNTQLINTDLRTIEPGNIHTKPDAILSNFGYLDENVLKQLLLTLKPGGRLAISGPQPLRGIRKLFYPITFVPEMVFGLTWVQLNAYSKHINFIKSHMTDVSFYEDTFAKYFFALGATKQRNE